jgi:hypothetical protein
MASGEAWQAGWSLGSQLAAHQRQRKEALSDEAREKHLGEYDTGIGNLQKKYQSQLKTDANGNTVETPESLKTKYALTQAHLQRNAILNPQPGQSVGGKIGQKIGEVLHLAKKPEAQSTTVQPTEVSAPATGVTLAATPGFSTAAAAAPVATPAPGPAAVPAQSTRTAYAPGTPEVALPPLEATLPAMQIGRPTTVRGPALNPAQLRAQAQANRQAQQETELSTAGAPAASLTPQQQAVQQAQAGTAGKMEKIRGDLDAIKAFHKDATPEQLKALTDAYLDKALGTTAPKEEKWTMVGKPYMKDGKAYFDEKSPTGEQRTSEWTGAPPAPPKLSAYQEQEAAFARTIGKEPSQWGEPETEAFLKMRYGGMQPLARARLAIADQTLHLNAARLQLAQAQNNMRDYLSVQKALTPFDKLKTTAERADEYVNNHNAEGDVALTLAFVDAIKPGTGFRFTDTERKWMVTGSRGVIDGAYAKINQGYTGETLTPEQRANMRNIIKQAAAQSDQQRNKTLAGFSQINPRVAKIAGGGNTPAPQQPKKGGGKTLADRLNDALGGK